MATRQSTERLDPDVFELPVEKMREGYYTDAYFNHTRATLLADGRHPRVVMQVFQRQPAMLGGIERRSLSSSCAPTTGTPSPSTRSTTVIASLRGRPC